MAWGRISDDFSEHPKVNALTIDTEALAVDLEGLAAVGFWSLALSWVRQDFSRKGVITVAQAVKMAGTHAKQLASRLVQVGLWAEVPGGWRFHDYEDVYPSEDLSAKRSAAGRRGGVASGAARRAAKAEARAKQVASEAEAKAEQPTHVRARPLPTNHYPPNGGTTANGRNAREADGPPPMAPVEPSTTEALLAEYVETCRRPPPSKERVALAKEIHALLTDDFTVEEVRHAISVWSGKSVGPGVLASIASELYARPAKAGNVIALRDDSWARDGPQSGVQSSVEGWLAMGRQKGAS
jgi:hypothetical protein